MSDFYDNIAYVLGHTLYLNITNRCPCACDFCIRTHSKSVGTGDNLWLEREPTQTEIMAALAQHDLSQYRELVFCGYGEPTCRLDDLLWVCNKVRGIRDIPIRVNTNGLSDLVFEKPTAQCLKGIVDTVSISLNSSDAQKYVDITRNHFGLKSYQAMIDYAKDCQKYVPNVVMTVVDIIGEEEVAACRKVCDDNGLFLRVRPYEAN